jgi:hypothetical protein
MSIDAQFTVSPATGDVYGTPFVFTNTTTGDIKNIVWDYGDGNIEYGTQNPTHIYNFPGKYAVSLSAFDQIGNISTYQTFLSADYVYRDYINFAQYPSDFSIPGETTSQPFVISVVSAQIDQPLYVQLFACNSPSQPEIFSQNKWNFLTPTWNFVDKNGSKTDQLLIDTVNLYNSLGNVVGLSGTGMFYFKDDVSIGNPVNNCPLILVATLQTSAFHVPTETNIYKYPSYSNTTVSRAALAWQIYDYRPDYLRVTGNYIDDISKNKWQGVKIPVMITGHTDKSKRYTGVTSTSSGILFNYPSSNAAGILNPVTLTLQTNTIPNLSASIDEAPLYFQQTDINGYDSGGYIFTTVTPLATANNVTITASLSTDENAQVDEWEFPYPAGYGASPTGWISNPENKSIVKVISIPYPDNCTTINYYKQNGTLIDTRMTPVDTPIGMGSTFNYQTSGYSGVYSMSVFPGDNSVIATDAELDTLYKFSSVGNLISSVSLSSVTLLLPLTAGATPAYASVDLEGSIWVTLYNSVSVLKFDNNFNLLTVACPTGIPIGPLSFDDDILKPAAVETDSNNNAWVTYTHPLCSLLVKYDTAGNTLLEISLGEYSSPVGLAVNKKNQVWVANTYSTYSSGGSINLFDTNGVLLSTVTGFSRPGYMTLDNKNNLWFTHGVRNIAYVDRVTGALSSWYIQQIPDGENTANTFRSFNDSTTNSINYPYLDPAFAASQDEEIGGLASDCYNRLWVIDSVSNNTYILSATPSFTLGTVKYFKVQPWTSVGYINDQYNTFTYAITAPGMKSAQAVGDWTGNKWFQKYANFSGVISGVSVPFNISSFDNPSTFRTVNESFDTAGYYKSLALPENLQQNTNLFDSFLAAIAGTGEPDQYEDIGQKIYERIANFLQNHNDVDTCNIAQLISLAESVGITVNNFCDVYPAEILRLINIASIPRAKLWGLQDLTPVATQTLYQSRNSQLNTQTDYVTAGSQIYLQSIFDQNMVLTTVPQIPEYSAIYPLSSYPSYGLIPPVTINYKFYNYKPVFSGEFIESIVDWNSPYTTVNMNLSTSDNIYNDGGLIETMFNYLLTKNIVDK